MRTLSALFVLLLPASALAGDAVFALKDGQRVVFLGDSNTHSGKFITYLDAYLYTRFPDKRFELINLGLPSETVSGLSEADHPYPRPNVHERVAQALELTKPNVVVVCYGMNDGIYSPFSEQHFKRYQEGTAKLIEQVEKVGAKVILMTPAPFDPKPLKDKVQPKGAPKYSWLRPYEHYDEEVLAKYSAWLLTLRDKKYVVIDQHAAVTRYLDAVRKDDPNASVSSDGIHPNADGHLITALEILKAWNAPAAVKEIVIDTKLTPPTKSDVVIKAVRGNSASFSFSWPHPMPVDPEWSPRVKKVTKFEETVNRSLLKIDGPKGALALSVRRAPANDKGLSCRVSTNGNDLSAGLSLGKVLGANPDPKGSDIFKLIAEKNRILGPAWLTHVGHKRPDTPKGLPLAEAQKKSAALDVEIRKLCQPEEFTLSVGPFGK